MSAVVANNAENLKKGFCENALKGSVNKTVQEFSFYISRTQPGTRNKSDRPAQKEQNIVTS